MKIVRHEELKPEEWPMENLYTSVASPQETETFRTVLGYTEDGTWFRCWISDKRPGYFYQVFVPMGKLDQHEIVLK